MWGKCREAVCAREVRGVDSGVWACGEGTSDGDRSASGRAEGLENKQAFFLLCVYMCTEREDFTYFMVVDFNHSHK